MPERIPKHKPSFYLDRESNELSPHVSIEAPWNQEAPLHVVIAVTASHLPEPRLPSRSELDGSFIAYFTGALLTGLLSTQADTPRARYAYMSIFIGCLGKILMNLQPPRGAHLDERMIESWIETMEDL